MRLKVMHLKRIAEDAVRLAAYRNELKLTVGQSRDLSEADVEGMIDTAVSQLYQYRVAVDPENQLKHYTHKRTVVPLVEMTTRFDQLLTLLMLNLPDDIVNNRDLVEQLPLEQWLFCHLDGTRIKSFDQGFDKALEKLKLIKYDGKKRSLTSIRHTYASERIEARAADLKLIADNMGTTVDMLYKHYAQEIRELRAADLQVI